MDYAYIGSSTAWPMTSTIASIAGILLIFGEHARKKIDLLTGLALEDLRRLPAWIIGPGVGCSVLLTLPLVAPESSWVVTLRGLARLDSEIDLARTDGYYEELNRSATDERKPSLAARPPDRKSFNDSGLIDDVSDYRHRLLRPSLNTRWNDKSFRTDALGHRGPTIALKKPPGTFRVIVLGSSNTMGHGVEDEETYVRRLEAWLNERAGQGRRIEVVNLAVSGDSPTQRLLRLQLEADALEPDWILADVTALDFSLEEQHLRWVVAHQTEIPFDFVRETLVSSQVNASDSTEAFHKKISKSLKPMLDRTYEAWKAEAHRIGAPLTLLILPRADSKIESPSLFQLFRDQADRHAIATIDLSGAFDRYDLDDYRIAPWDHHPNALGHRIIFERLRDAMIIDRKVLDRIY